MNAENGDPLGRKAACLRPISRLELPTPATDIPDVMYFHAFSLAERLYLPSSRFRLTATITDAKNPVLHVVGVDFLRQTCEDRSRKVPT